MRRSAGRVIDHAGRRWGALPTGTQDVVLALTAAVALGAYYLIGSGLSGTDWPALGLVIAACLPLAARRRLPLTVAAASTVAVLLGAALFKEAMGLWAALATVGSAAYHTERNRWALALASGLWMVGTVLVSFPSFGLYDAVTATVLGTAPVLFGYALRVKAHQVEQEARLHQAQSLRERSDERARIARDVHDIVGHHLSAIRIQAVGGRRVLRHTPNSAGKALDTIANTCQLALEEIRDLLELLREDVSAQGPESPQLSDLGDLVARLSAGRPSVTVTLTSGVERRVPPVVQTCLYRIAQESLTNVVRHSTADEATVRVELTDREVVITVEDDGKAARDAAGSGGRGLRGMRDRVRLLGGDFHHGPRDQRGWLVRAALPVEAEEIR